MPKNATLLDAYELLTKHPGALGVEAVIDEWHYVITKAGTGYLVFRSPAETIGLSLQRLSFANEDALRQWILEHTPPLVPAPKDSEQLPIGMLPLLADTHGQIMEHIKDATTYRWDKTLLAAKVSEALADLIMAVLDDTMSSSGT